MVQKTVLGKGLASLLPPSVSAGPATPFSPPPLQDPTAGSSKDRHMGISLIGVDDIVTNQYQPRRDFDPTALSELAQSIETSGIIQPLVVRKNTKDQYELIAGERRLRAAKLAGLKQVPVVIRRSTTDRESLELALVENIQRQNLNCIDEALAYFQLVQDFLLTQEEIAERVGKDRATVANHLRLLKLPEAIIQDLRMQILSLGHGKALLSLEDNEMRLRARTLVIEQRMSVRETEHLIEQMKQSVPTSHQPNQSISHSVDSVTQRLRNLSLDLSRDWSTQVEVKGNENKGKIVIHYTNRQELDRILEGIQIHK